MSKKIPPEILDSTMDAAELDPHAKERMRRANEAADTKRGHGAPGESRMSFAGADF